MTLHYLCVNRVSRKHQIPQFSHLSTPPLELCSPLRLISSLNGWTWTALLRTSAVYSTLQLLCSPTKKRSKRKNLVSLMEDRLRRSLNMGKKEKEKKDGLLSSQRMGTWGCQLLQPFSFVFFVVCGCCWMWCWKSLDDEEVSSWMQHFEILANRPWHLATAVSLVDHIKSGRHLFVMKMYLLLVWCWGWNSGHLIAMASLLELVPYKPWSQSIIQYKVRFQLAKCWMVEKKYSQSSVTILSWSGSCEQWVQGGNTPWMRWQLIAEQRSIHMILQFVIQKCHSDWK